MKKYQKDFDYSYTLGIFPSLELLHNKPTSVFKIVLSEKFENQEILRELNDFSSKYEVEIETNDNTIMKLSDKENCYLIVFFKKEKHELEKEKSHVVLVNPSNIGNVGNIIRTILGFGINNLAIVSPAVDTNDPKAIRASMGAVFSTNVEYFESFKEYEKKYANHIIYPFVLKGKNTIASINKTKEPYSLVFGNESSGLPDSFLDYENTVLIKHSNKIDSLNLTIAIGIALYEFTKNNFN